MKKVILSLFAIALITVLSGCTSDSIDAGDVVSETSPGCSCSGNVYNCDDFSSHREAQACYEKCGGASNDVHELDRDKDGSACETL